MKSDNLTHWCSGCKSIQYADHLCDYKPIDINSKIRELAKESLHNKDRWNLEEMDIDREIERVLETIFKLSNL